MANKEGVGLPIVAGLIGALAPKPDPADPEVIEAAVSDWLDDHPEAACPIDDTAGHGDTDVVWSAGKTYDTIADVTGCTPIEVTSAKHYIDLSGSSVTMSNGQPALSGSSGSYDVSYVACSAGDGFIISGTGGASTRLWGFINSTGTILARAKESDTEENVIVVAPEGSAFIIVHTSDGKSSYKGEPLKPVQTLLTHQYINFDSIVQGSISNSTGLVIDSTTRVCAEDYIPWEENMLVMVNGNLKFSLRYYAANKGFLGGDNSWTDGCGFVGKYGDVQPGYIRIVFALRNDATLTPSALGTVTILRSAVSSVDKTLTQANKAADAKTVGDLIDGALGKVSSSQSLLGNMTVRAAKVINFTDHYATSKVVVMVRNDEDEESTFQRIKDTLFGS